MPQTLQRIKLGAWGGVLLFCQACSDQQAVDQHQQSLQQQAQQQGYPVLIAMPTVAHYALPFCEQQYCIAIDIQALRSQDAWFDQTTEHLISELIRKKLNGTQKLSLQKAVDGFIQQSDQWQLSHPQAKAWSMHIQSRVLLQQSALSILQVQAHYQIKDQRITPQDYFFILDRQQQQVLRLFEAIKAESRSAFAAFVQQRYQQWRSQLTTEQQNKLPAKISWANQDWYINEQQRLVIYVRPADFDVQGLDPLRISLSHAQATQWLDNKVLQQLASA
jgi:hypothetical protein